MIIDSHHHFWQYTPYEYGWINDDRLRRDFLPDDFAPVLSKARVDRVVTIQSRQSETETRWLLQLADLHANIAGVVGWMPLVDPQIEDCLAEYSRHPKLRGVRHVLQGEADDDFMLRKDFDRGIGLLKQFNLAYDLLILPRHLPNAIKLVDRHPRQVFVLDHLAKPLEGSSFTDWTRDLRTLATRSNVYCKLAAGVIEIDPARTSLATVQPFFDVALEAFGAQRLMFGSNWPLTEVAGGYHAWLDIVEAWARPLAATEREQLFSSTAMTAYQLPS